MLNTILFRISGWSSYRIGSGHYSSTIHSDPNPVVIISAMLFPLVVFLIYYYYLKHRQRHKIIEWLGSKKVPAFSEFAFREVQILLAVVMLKRDRYLQSPKFSMMKKHARNYFPKEKLDVEEIVDVYLDEKVPMTELIAWCNENLSYEQKLETFCYVHEIAAIDGEMLDAEKEYLLYLVRKFALRNQDIPNEIAEKLFETNKKAVSASFSIVQSYYEVLEITSDATDKDVKESYRKLVKQFHPDSHPHLTAEEKKVLSDKFQKVQEAYDHLMSN